MHDPASPSTQGKTLRTTQSLLQAGLISHDDQKALEAVAQRYATAIPPAFQKLITSANDPIGLQVVPSSHELEIQPHEDSDPIGDDALSPVPGIVHRYEDRALLKPLLICPLYCRFCFRREHVGPDGGLLSDEALETAFRWIEEHPQIKEIILTGGDPLMLSPRRMRHIMERLSSIAHIEIIRIHTRVPIATPERITTELLNALETDRALWLVVHTNHARELTQDVRAAIKAILCRGIPILSQSVLLRGVNDTTAALENLFRSLISMRIKPYYLHHLDSAPGTAHFHVPVEEGRALLESLRGRVSGLIWPTYVVDIPGGKGKVPLGPDYLLPLRNEPKEVQSEPQRHVRSPDGKQYPFT